MATNKHREELAAMTETPFNQRHCCWFCGEPNQVHVIFPPHQTLSSYHKKKHLVLNCPHPVIAVPSCKECQGFANKANENNIWSVNASVKKQLLGKYAKDLAIGVNWTPQELASSEFEEGNFAGFARSAWFIYEVARGRVNFVGWPLVANGLLLDEGKAEQESFCFDGVDYPDVSEAISHYANIFFLDSHYFSAVLQQVSNGMISQQSFAKAVRFCRLLVNATPNELKAAFKELQSNSV